MSDPLPRMGVFGAHARALQGLGALTHGDGVGSSATPSGTAPQHGSIQSGPASGTQQQATFGSDARTEQWYSQRPRCAHGSACLCGPPSAGGTPDGVSYQPLTVDQLRSWQLSLEQEQHQLEHAQSYVRAGYGSSSAEQSGRVTPCA